MEGSILLKNHQHGTFDFVSKSMKSSIKVDSISIDLINASEKTDTEKCDHFSIRGYVSQIHKKDWKMCSPFALDSSNDEEQTCSLPPLDVPKFKFWRCQNCLQEIDAKGTTKDFGPILKACTTGFKFNSICFHTPMIGKGVKIPPDFQQATKLYIFEEGKVVDTKASAGLSKINECQPSCTDKKEEKNEAENGQAMVSEKILNLENHRLPHVVSDVNSRFLQKTYRTDDRDFNSKCKGSIALCKPDGRCHEAADAEFAENLSNMFKNAAEVSEAGKETSADHHQREELIACGTSGEAGNVKEVHGTDKVNSSGHLPLELDECGNASSESADITVGNKHQSLHHDNSVGKHHKKIRKVRLLTELLSENGDKNNSNNRIENSPSNAIPDASTLVEKLPIPQSQVAIQQNVRKCVGHSKKRKFPQDEDCRPLVTSSPDKANKVVKSSKGDAEAIGDSVGSESEDTFTEFSSQTGMKKHCTKRRIDSSLIIGKKKNKRTLIFDECLPLMPSQENVSIETGNKTGGVTNGNAVDGVLSKSGNTAITGRERERDFFALPAEGIEINPSFSNMKDKMPKFHGQQFSLNPLKHVMLNEGEMTGKDADITQTGPAIVPFHSAEDALGKMGLSLSLNSYLATQVKDKERILEVEDRQTSPLIWQDISGGGQVKRNAPEINCVGNFSFTSKPVAETPVGKIHSDLSSKRPPYGMPLLNERQNYISQVEAGGLSLMQQKEFCGTSSNEKLVGSQEHPTLTRKDNDHRADKTSEQGTLDDIPMEIVELMAKNQYERCLADTEFEKRQLQTNNSTQNAQATDFTGVYGQRELNLLQQVTAQKQKCGHQNGKNGIIKRNKNKGPTKQKSVDYFSQAYQNQLNMSQAEQTHTSSGFDVIDHCQEKPSSGGQHPASCSIRQNGVQNCKWIGDMPGKRFCHSSLQVYGPCNTCPSFLQQGKESNHLWSSLLPNRMPSVYSAPRTCAALHNNMDVFSHARGGMRKQNMIRDHDLKYLNESVSYTGKQNRNFNSETVSRECSVYPSACKHKGIEYQTPVGSLDLYSNETIPAMHLLSLMDAGLRSNAPINLDATPKYLRRPAAHDRELKDFSRLDTVAYKATNSMKCPPYDYHGKNQAAEDSHERVPLVPSISAIPAPAGSLPSTSSFPNDKTLKTINFANQVSQEKERRKDSDSYTQNKGYKSQKSVSTCGNFGTTCGSIPVHSMQTMFFGTSDSRVFPWQYYPFENSIKRKLEASNSTGTVYPYKNSCKTEVCSLNRNPSDFSIPEAGNVYMIAGEDLKFGKEVPPNGPKLMKMDGNKRQRKHHAVKEHKRHLFRDCP